jgi:ABC-type bacteriocin/lantibiotic exporter with double-glycine peptidase domain
MIPADPLGRTSMAELITGVQRLGLAAAGLNLSPSALCSITHPLILHVEESHFLVAISNGAGRVVLIDPPHAPRAVSVRSLGAVWTGNCALVALDESDLNRRLEDLGLD